MKKKKLRQSLAFLMAATMALSVTGCGGSGSDDTKEKKETKSAEDTNWEGAKKAAYLSGKVTYMHSGDDYEREMYANVFSTYQQYAPDVEVEQMYVPSDYDTKLQTLAVADDLPDLGRRIRCEKVQRRRYAFRTGQRDRRVPTVDRGHYRWCSRIW